MGELQEFLAKAIDMAKKNGADEADAICYKNDSVTVSTRLGKVEDIQSANSKGFGLRVIIGKKHSIISSDDMRFETLESMAKQATDMAKLAPEDPYMQLAEKNQLADTDDIKDLEIYDDSNIAVETLIDNAKRAEESALSVANITSSEGATAGYSKNIIAFASSNGFAQTYKTSNHNIAVSVIAGEGLNMQTDYDFCNRKFFSDLKLPEIIGREAGERTVKKLNPKKITTKKMPVLFDSRVSKSIISNFASAINGGNIAKNTSFLCNKLGKEIFPKNLNIIDDATIKRGLGSRPFDGEGLISKKKFLVKDGVLVDYFLDIRSAKKLNLLPNSSAVRGLASNPSPSPTNLYLENGSLEINSLIAGIKEGLYITDLFGMGVNLITGDYSQGIYGFYIENGKITYPVSEVTIASNLLDMFKNLTICNDLSFNYNVNSPSFLVENMTVAGS